MSDEALYAAVEAAVDAHFEAAQVPWMRRLVEQPSHTGARDSVEAAAQILDELAGSLGLSIRRVPDPSGTYADHRVYATPATQAGDRTPALVGHVDTVFPPSLGFLHFTRDDEGRGDIVRGPGVLDMKSGLSAMLFALQALREAAPERFEALKLRVVVVSDEEVGSPSSEPLFAELAPKLSEALVFEAGRVEDKIVTARKGGGMFRVVARGRAAHAGNHHEDGISAIHAVALLIPRVEALTDYARGVTVSVGLIEGGTAKNTVPEEASFVIDTRFERVSDAEEVVAKLEALVARPFEGLEGVPDKLHQVEMRLEGQVTRPPMEPTPVSQALRLRYEAHAAACGLKVGEAPLQGGGSDANLLAAAGVPCIDGLGPWGRHFHKVQEWSSLDSLRRRTAALARYLVDCAGSAPTPPPTDETEPGSPR